MSKTRYVVSDAMWTKIEPWIPARENPHPRKGGRKPKDNRIVFNAILFVLHTGSQWNAYNFCWPVRTLRAKEDDGHYRHQTLAMVAQLADHIWSIKEWALFPVAIG